MENVWLLIWKFRSILIMVAGLPPQVIAKQAAASSRQSRRCTSKMLSLVLLQLEADFDMTAAVDNQKKSSNESKSQPVIKTNFTDDNLDNDSEGLYDDDSEGKHGS